MENATSPKMSEEVNPGSALRTFLPVIVAIILIAAAFAGWQWWTARQKAIAESDIAAQQEQALLEISDAWGIRPDHIAVLADGGLLEFSFQITDPDKVIFMYEDLANIPRMIDEDTGVEIAINNLPHSHDVPAGLTEYIIYRNAQGAVEPGDFVKIIVGDLEYPHFQVLK